MKAVTVRLMEKKHDEAIDRLIQSHKENVKEITAYYTAKIAELESTAQPVIEPYKLNCWISVADRLPSEFGRYLCYVEEQNDLGKSHYQWNCYWNGDVFSDSSLTGRVTHWMPLPEAPEQESE